MAAKSTFTKKQLLKDVSPEWVKYLDTKLLGSIIEELADVKDITPTVDKVFEFARLTDVSKISIIIIGQDPYPSSGDAHGLAFSCKTGVPASLKNIYKCLLKNKLIESMPNMGDLTYWAKQGVLLLNRSLTTVVGKSNVHAALWNDYTARLVKKLTAQKPLVVMLWGNNAKQLNDESIIGGKSIVYEWSHPSPLAQAKQSFLDCPHFREANQTLIKLGHTPIDWNITPPQSEIELSFGIDPMTCVVFTDGSCYPNKSCPEARAGYAACFSLGVFKDTLLYGNIENEVEFATNQRAEGMAIIKTFEFLADNLDEWQTCIIVSDSEFWIKMLESYMPAWYRKGGLEAFNEKKNPDMTKQMYKVYQDLLDNEKLISFRHVKSHNKSGWKDYGEDTYENFCYVSNEYVDKFAEFARIELKPGEHEIEEVEYGK